MSEERLQSEVVKWIKLKYPKSKHCASLGGIYTGPRQAIKAKRTGYSRGFPDLQICEARGGYFGLFIELKTIKGNPINMIDPPTGCIFRTRCSNPTHDCNNGRTTNYLIEKETNHWVDQCCVNCN